MYLYKRQIIEKFVLVFPSAVRQITACLLLASPLAALRKLSLDLIQIDTPMRRSDKVWIDIRKVKWRLDVTGIVASGTSLASDVRDYNRGPLIVGEGWTKEFQHPMQLNPAAVTNNADYRHGTHSTVRMMFLEGKPFTDTPEYELFRSKIESGTSTGYGITSMGELAQRGVKLQLLYENMKIAGFRPSQLVGQPYWDEAHVYVDPEGDLCFGRHANHRMAIARVLGINKVPVLIGGIHKEFAIQLGDPRHLKTRLREYIAERFD